MQVLCGSRILYDQVRVADRFWTRMRGLLGRRGLADGEGLLIIPCNQVHTLSMRFSLDLIFLDRNLRVQQLVTLEPGRISPLIRSASSVLEVTAGSAARLAIRPGDQLSILPQPTQDTAATRRRKP